MDNNILSPDDKKLCFDAFVEEYKEKTLLDKQKLIIKDLKEMVALFQQLCFLYKIENHLLINREIVDVNSDSYSQDDFAEAVYVYLQMFKESLSTFMLPIIEDNNEIDY